MDLKAAHRLAVTLMEQHGLQSWSFGWDRAVSRMGQCDGRKRRISLSVQPTELRPEAEVRNTILHEIAHALVGTEHHHDFVWQVKARSIGCTGERCSTTTVRVERPWIAECPNHGQLGRSHRRRKLVCRRCKCAIRYTAVADFSA